MPSPARTLSTDTPPPELEAGTALYEELSRLDSDVERQVSPPGRLASQRARWSASWAALILGSLCGALLLARYCGVWSSGRSETLTRNRAEQAWDAKDGPPPGFEYLVHPLGTLPEPQGPAKGYVASDDGSGISPMEPVSQSIYGIYNTSKAGAPLLLAQPTLLCFSLMMPDSYEMDLMQMFWKQKVSIFACDEYTVFSAESFELVPSVMTEGIGDTHCNYGGPYNLALNSDIFVRVWKRVIALGVWKLNDWTLKVDPDSVFLPQRLRDRVRGLDPEGNTYLNNCDQGLHGPIEVIARGGMTTYAQGMDDCVSALSDEFSWGGEDVFLRHCWRHLNISRVDDFRLLSEDHCMWENPAQNGCFSGKVAFHPFKSVDSYSKCLEETEATTTSTTSTLTATTTVSTTATTSLTVTATTSLCDPSVMICDDSA